MQTNATRSPLAPSQQAVLGPVAGVELAVAETATKYKSRPDLLLVAVPEGTAVAGVLTRSSTASAPVDWCRANLPAGSARALLVNAGNANAFAGSAGLHAVEATAAAVSERLGCRPAEVFLASTGVIGEPLDPEPIVALIDDLANGLSDEGWADAARAIMTTDTYPKLAAAKATLDGAEVRINGIAKGSGMIAPDMATMLAFVFTDAAIKAPVLQALLADAVARSFNCITVDSDTSTSDTVLAFATGAAGGVDTKAADDPRLAGFRDALEDVCLDLALQVVRDGEGAQKLITVDVTGAADNRAAHRIALSIANSPLVKTAIAGADANWGRIVMAIGKSGEKAVRDKIAVSIGGVRVARDGMIDPDYREETLEQHMAGRDVRIAADVGVGKGHARVWTCDLTHGYIDINADYRS